MSKNKPITLITLFVLMGCICAVRGGTIIYEDKSLTGQSAEERKRVISDVKILSISKGYIVIEKDRATKRIPASWLKEYYDTDLKNAETGLLDDDTAEYDVRINKVDMPEYGQTKKNKDTTYCEISYRISKNDKERKTDKVKRPFFYLYILTSGPNEYGNSNIYCYYWPKEAKIKGKSYDRAQMLDKVASLKRTVIYVGHNPALQYDMDNKKKLGASSNDSEIKIKLSGIKGRRILAYHLEVWGKKDIVTEKDWQTTGVRIGKKWWLH